MSRDGVVLLKNYAGKTTYSNSTVWWQRQRALKPDSLQIFDNDRTGVSKLVSWCKNVNWESTRILYKKVESKKTSCVLLWSLARILLRVFSLIWHKHIALKPSQSGNNTACLTALLFFKNVQCASGLTVRYTSAARAPPLTKMQAREDHRQWDGAYSSSFWAGSLSSGSSSTSSSSSSASSSSAGSWPSFSTNDLRASKSRPPL